MAGVQLYAQPIGGVLHRHYPQPARVPLCYQKMVIVIDGIQRANRNCVDSSSQERTVSVSVQGNKLFSFTHLQNTIIDRRRHPWFDAVIDFILWAFRLDQSPRETRTRAILDDLEVLYREHIVSVVCGEKDVQACHAVLQQWLSEHSSLSIDMLIMIMENFDSLLEGLQQREELQQLKQLRIGQGNDKDNDKIVQENECVTEQQIRQYAAVYRLSTELYQLYAKQYRLQCP